MSDRIKLFIEEIQRELLVQGINPGPIDGVMGGRTYQAILAYQKRGERPTTPQKIKTIPSPTQPQWRLAKSLETLRAQINAAYPRRNRKSDGTIGDAAHAKRKSDHNPLANGVVTAIDITHDPANGVDCHNLARLIIQDPRVEYVIWNEHIYNAAVKNAWRKYEGTNPHTKHMHISVHDTPEIYDNDAPWRIT